MRRITLNMRLRLVPALAIALTLAPPASAAELSDLSGAIRQSLRELTMPHFEYAIVDLNDDGISDAVVRLTDSRWCGSGGCTMLILRAGAHGYTLISKSTITQKPMKVTPEVLLGWHTLLVSVGGGGMPGGVALMRFNGSRYPGNPSVQPQATHKQMAAATELDFHEGQAQ